MEGVKQAFIEDSSMEVLDMKQYFRRSQLENPAFDNTCVQNGNTLYPIRMKKFNSQVGAYPVAPGIVAFSDPKREIAKNYSASKVIDFGNCKNYAEFIKKTDQLANEETARLITKDNVFNPIIDPNDSPELQLIKEALDSKKIDPEAYRQRLGPDFSNTMRLVTSRKNHSITLKKMKSLAKAYDLEIDITISDKKDAVNPIRGSITKRVTGFDEIEGEDED